MEVGIRNNFTSQIYKKFVGVVIMPIIPLTSSLPIVPNYQEVWKNRVELFTSRIIDSSANV